MADSEETTEVEPRPQFGHWQQEKIQAYFCSVRTQAGVPHCNVGNLSRMASRVARYLDWTWTTRLEDLDDVRDKDAHLNTRNLIGKGGFAKVYATDVKGESWRGLVSSRSYAVKVLDPQGAKNPQEFIDLALHEADILRMLSMLRCPFVPRFETVFRCGDVVHIVMERVEGSTLAQLLRRNPKLESRLLIQRLLENLSETHQIGLAHRDVKPENIILRKDGTLVLVDWALAKWCTNDGPVPARHVTDQDPLTAGNELLTVAARGTPNYLHHEAPLQTRSEGSWIRARDIFSVGLVALLLHDPSSVAMSDGRPVPTVEWERKIQQFEQTNPSLHNFLHATIAQPLAQIPSAQEALNYQWVKGVSVAFDRFTAPVHDDGSGHEVEDRTKLTRENLIKAINRLPQSQLHLLEQMVQSLAVSS
eukprot:TRINITY_DN4578_c0_g1_i1.p1 TRINITY_DN4578_c0_g1~~TRINITY_DN4578_c0_g1_i1.p1  ORF type:complete len:419 (-),score=62.08 TRINITY_DN4578_c0_g1_i1:706-1962(-)